jgi:Tol biopolymer transport system component
MAADGSGRKTITKVAQGGLAKDPAWAPDGKRIAYAYTPPLPAVRGPGGLVPLPVTGVYVMNSDGSDPKVAIPHETPGVGHESPVWARDGRSFYVTYSELIMESNIVKDQVVEVALVTPGAAQRQTLIPNGAFPALTADGRQLVCVVTSREGMALVLANADGKSQRVLVPPGQLDGLASPRFSPDGKQVAFSAVAPMAPIPTVTPVVRRSRLGALLAPLAAEAHGLPMDVFTVPAEGGQPRRLTQLGEDNPSVAWAPDGKRIAILAGGGLYLMDADGGGFASLDSKGGHGSIDWRAA